MTHVPIKTKNFRDLLVWQKSMQLAREVYAQTALLPKSETFGLQSQMRRAAVSVPSNIAEGRGRSSDAYLRAFLWIARGSLYELETQVQLCLDLQMMEQVPAQELMKSCQEVERMINSFAKTLKAKDTKQATKPIDTPLVIRTL